MVNSSILGGITKTRIHLESLAVKFLAFLTAMMGVINLVSGILPAVRNRLQILEQVLPLEVQFGSRLATVLAAFGLLILAGNLGRRKRMAWIITIGLLVLSIFAHLLKGLDYEETLVAATLLILLIAFRKSFHAESDRPSIRQGIYVLFGGVLFTALYGTLGFYLLDRHFNIRFTILGALRQVGLTFFSFTNPGVLPLNRFSNLFLDSIYIVAAATMGFALLMLIRPVLVRRSASPEEWDKATRIVETYGNSSLARAALFPDKQLFFSPGGSLIAYAVRGRGVVVLGEPIGPRRDLRGAIKAFDTFCRQRDWLPAYMSVLPGHLNLYQSLGYDSLCLGNEAIIPLQEFTLEGADKKPIRNPFNKLTRLGYRIEYFPPPINKRIMKKLNRISDDWLDGQFGGEMHFSVGWFDENYLKTTGIIAVFKPGNEIVAFANLVGEYQRNEITLDLMRHYRDVENGTMEFLFVSMLLWAKEQGYGSFSLGGSGLIEENARRQAPIPERALNSLSGFIQRYYNFSGLHTFKKKFNPLWEPRYLVYKGLVNLPMAITSMVRVHYGRDFIWKLLGQFR